MKESFDDHPILQVNRVGMLEDMRHDYTEISLTSFLFLSTFSMCFRRIYEQCTFNQCTCMSRLRIRFFVAVVFSL